MPRSSARIGGKMHSGGRHWGREWIPRKAQGHRTREVKSSERPSRQKERMGVAAQEEFIWEDPWEA